MPTNEYSMNILYQSNINILKVVHKNTEAPRRTDRNLKLAKYGKIE